MRPASPSLKNVARSLLAVLVTVIGITYLRALLLSRKGPLVRVMLLHHIKDVDRFRAMIRLLAHRYHPLTLSDFLSRRFVKGKVNILLTFDDGYETWYTNGLPVLERYEVPAVFFVSSGFIDAAENPDCIKSFCKDNLLLTRPSSPMSPQMLKKVAEHRLISIGGHTRNHRFLSNLEESMIVREVGEDKIRLEEMIGKKILTFAYPFGVYDARCERAAESAGYLSAFTTENDFYSTGSKRFAIPRSNHGTVHPLFLRLWIWGAYDIVDIISHSFGRKVKRTQNSDR